jgi:hypothetical protein
LKGINCIGMQTTKGENYGPPLGWPHARHANHVRRTWQIEINQQCGVGLDGKKFQGIRNRTASFLLDLQFLQGCTKHA